MKRIGLGLVLAVGLAVSACQGLTPAAVSSGVSQVCSDVALLPIAVTRALDAQAPTSALGVLWADAKAGCSVGAPALGVSTDWTALVFGELKALAPVAIPWLIGLL